MYEIPEPHELYDRYMDKQESELEKLPKCTYCQNHIHDDYAWNIDGDFFCEECATDLFRVALW